MVKLYFQFLCKYTIYFLIFQIKGRKKSEQLLMFRFPCVGFLGLIYPAKEMETLTSMVIVPICLFLPTSFQAGGIAHHRYAHQSHPGNGEVLGDIHAPCAHYRRYGF